jgi:hypothetical protein
LFLLFYFDVGRYALKNPETLGASRLSESMTPLAGVERVTKNRKKPRERGFLTAKSRFGRHLVDTIFWKFLNPLGRKG